jgi:ubiquinone/menaquinone biosynthesis C-methylase UbiE
MSEFWENNFKDKQKMWGEGPAPAAVFASSYFKEHGIKSVLIPGIGYGRNAIPFLEAGMQVTGIEISETAINIAKEQMGIDSTIYHGSVTDMPFDSKQYNGIFCYALIHLLGDEERKKLIEGCYKQLVFGGVMIFVAVSTKAPNFGKGIQIGKNRFEQHGGAQIYFYDEESIRKEFAEHGLQEIQEVHENQMSFLIAICKKG